MIKSIFKVIVFTLFISLVFGEFELMKKSRGYVESTDYLSIKIRGTNCQEFLKKGGLADRIRGGYSHHCLPINTRGDDVDDLKFIGRCLNHNKNVVLSIFEIQRKREYSSRPKHGRPNGKLSNNRPLQDDDKKKKKAIRSFEGPTSHHEEQNVQFYIRLTADDQPVEFKVKSFHLNKGHVYQVRRPTCIKARNFCPSKKTSRESLMVIDCDRSKLAEGLIGKHETVYLEVTKRDVAPDTCVDKKNGYCCRYVNNEVKGGICDFYNRRNGPSYGSGFGPNNQNDKKEDNILPIKEEIKSENNEKTDKKTDEVAPSSNDSDSLSPDEEEIEMEEVIEEDGSPLESTDKKTDNVATDVKKSDNKENKSPVEPAKKNDEEAEGEEIDEKSLTDSKEKRKMKPNKKSNKKPSNKSNNNQENFNDDLFNNENNESNDNKKNDSSSDEFDIFEEDLEEPAPPVSNNNNDDDKKNVVAAAPSV
eukprot:TRINITY_DN237_c0_g2_i1.p1 TRINITY_DN237_c0_g2~~TRINITY_DN237_c0_g2_i1.p1  ORF type:complete len:475 (+),score=206.87 TRINITY_DN237_c0_g2_i1:86-1510(+)